MLDMRFPDEPAAALVLPEDIRSRVNEFVALVAARDRLAEAGVPAPSRLLLVGAPGTGKSSIARAIAKELELPMLTSRSDALVSSLLGQTSRNIRSVFDYAARTPCVLFLDEFDALAKSRADSQEVGELQRVVISLLQNLDAVEGDVLVIAATNHPQLLDSAVWRRFDVTIQTREPSQLERVALWRQELSSLAGSETWLAELAEASRGWTGARIVAAATDILQQSVLTSRTAFDAPFVFRRIARFSWYQESEPAHSDADEASRLRRWLPRVFTVRALASLFGVSTRQIGNMLEAEDGADRAPATAVAVQGR